jgi:hypothetical protein
MTDEILEVIISHTAEALTETSSAVTMQEFRFDKQAI